jgi:hypothetical protein
VHDKYHGGEQVHAANRSGMEILLVDHSTAQSLTHKVHLKHILHVPTASKSLVFVNCLTRDNNAFVEFHPDHFFIKEAATRKTLVRYRSEGGLYLLKSLSFESSSLNKQAFAAVRRSTSLWHSRLGHASTFHCSESS